MGGTTYFDFLQAVADYYGSGSDQWLQIAQYGTTADDFLTIVDQMPNYRAVVSSSGEILGYEQISSSVSSSIGTAIDSNLPATTTTIGTPATVEVSEVTGEVVATKGITTATGLQFITKEVVPAIAAAGIGITLGKTIDKLLYNVNPDYWNSIGMRSLDPDTWDTIVTNDTISGAMFNLLFGIDQTNQTTQAYIDENALAYLALYMQNQGFFNDNGKVLPEDLQPNLHYPNTFYDVNFKPGLESGTYALGSPFEFTDPINTAPLYTGCIINPNGIFSCVCASKEPFTVTLKFPESYVSPTQVLTGIETTYNGITYYVNISRVSYQTLLTAANNSSARTYYDISINPGYVWDLMYITEFGEIPENMHGIGDQPGAVLPDLAGLTTIAAILAALKTQYPELWDNAIEYPVMQGDGTKITYKYVPIAFPQSETSTDTEPVGDGKDISQEKPAYDPETMPEDVWKDLEKIIERVKEEVSDDTGTGDTPTVILPTGSAKSLFAIYNPTQSELNAFGAWLWSSDFVEQLKKLFNDPMQSIIGLHKIFASPTISGRDTIHVGYLDSQVDSNVVGAQYVTVPCGTVSLNEYFNNVFDYDPHTEVNLYLPFIGIERLSTGDVMRGSISVVYHIDVITGACLAEVNVVRDGCGGTLYTYAGNCAVQYPVSSGSYMGIVASIASIAGGIAGTIATGGALAPVAMGSVSGILNAHTRVQHSGSFSGNTGAMGIKKPYLIITRPQPVLPVNFPNFKGLPANDTVLLGECSGFVKCSECHLENIPATGTELTEIESLLKSGVLI